jgi:hypothetical protein
MAVVSEETAGVVTLVTVYFRTLAALVDPVAYASTLGQEIISAAGLQEGFSLSDFHLVSQETRGSYRYYCVTAAVTV